MPTFEDLVQQLQYVLAGLAAEEVVLGVAGAGAGGGSNSDLARATQIAVMAISAYGMRPGPQRLLYRGLPASPREVQALLADQGIARDAAVILEQARLGAMEVIREHRQAHDALVEALLSRSFLLGAEVDHIVRTSSAIVAPEATLRIQGVEFDSADQVLDDHCEPAALQRRGE